MSISSRVSILSRNMEVNKKQLKTLKVVASKEQAYVRKEETADFYHKCLNFLNYANELI